VQVLIVIISIIGLVVGAGFVSGKEVLTFYSRFGIWSFLGIIISFFIFWGLIGFLLNFNKNNSKNSKILSIISLIITSIFSSAMFAGVNKLIVFKNNVLTLFLLSVVFLLCFLIFKNGFHALKKLNMILVPAIILTIVVLFCKYVKVQGFASESNFSFLAIVYGIFYSMLNIANGSFVLINLGIELSKKQKAQVSFISALVLALLLTAVNILLLQNPQITYAEMPLLEVLSGMDIAITSAVVMVGALTSLLSLIYTSSSIVRGLCKNEILTFFISVVVPYVASLLGFSYIITYLYPLASSLAIVLMGDIFFKREN